MTPINLFPVTLEHVTLNHAVLEPVTLEHVTIEHVTLEHVTLEQVTFEYVTFEHVTCKPFNTSVAKQIYFEECSGCFRVSNILIYLKQVKCVFVTDGIIEDPVQRALVLQERNRFKDLEFLPVAGGLVFGQRFLNQIKWAKAKFDFQYLLKIDDDYFLCLKRLLSELPMRPTNKLVWANFHCDSGITWADEGFVIFTRDLIHKFLAQDKNKMLCHPFGDQTYHLWLNNMNKTYFHDSRLYHDPPASFSPLFQNITNVCDLYIGIHGTYEKKNERI